MMKNLWITWESQRRNRSMSTLLDAKLVEIISNKPRLIRYLISIYKTINIIRKEQPEIIFSQNPSIVLAITSLVSGYFFQKIVIIDAHNSGLSPLEGKHPWLTSVFMWINCKADIVLVTNKSLAGEVRKYRGKAFVFPDPIPEIECPEKKDQLPVQEKNSRTYNLVMVCSWSDDEPILEFFKAANTLNHNIVVWITGKGTPYIEKHGLKVPENIRLTGFLSQKDYDELLCKSDAVIVLTKRENCLVCGAYEAVSAGKPILLSAKKALQDHFYKGTVFTDNAPESISKSITSLVQQKSRLQEEISTLRQELREESLKDKTKLLKISENLRK